MSRKGRVELSKSQILARLDTPANKQALRDILERQLELGILRSTQVESGGGSRIKVIKPGHVEKRDYVEAARLGVSVEKIACEERVVTLGRKGRPCFDWRNIFS